MLDWLKTLKGYFQGYGNCRHCHHTWNWKKGHNIPYAASKNRTHLDGAPYHYAHMFPLCEACYNKLSPQERFDYCKKLYHSWNRPEKNIEWDTIAEHVGLRLSDTTAKEEEA